MVALCSSGTLEARLLWQVVAQSDIIIFFVQAGTIFYARLMLWNNTLNLILELEDESFTLLNTNAQFSMVQYWVHVHINQAQQIFTNHWIHSTSESPMICLCCRNLSQITLELSRVGRSRHSLPLMIHKHFQHGNQMQWYIRVPVRESQSMDAEDEVETRGLWTCYPEFLQYQSQTQFNLRWISK